MSIDQFTFADFIRIWARVALILIFVEVYLTVNKIWIRKHEKVVSESVSVAAQLLALVTGVPFIALYALEGAYEGAISDGLFLLVNLVMIMIGIGFWVDGRRKFGFWENLKKAMRLEKDEAATLLVAFGKPAGASHVLRILYALAHIDNKLDQRELEFIQAFAEQWGLDYESGRDAESHSSRDGESFTHLRKLVQEYVSLSPPHEQAAQLRDVLSLLAGIDDDVSEEEDIMMQEIGGIIDHYVGDSRSAGFAVFIAPQNSAQDAALQEILPRRQKEQRLGGEVFKVGQYHSERYANLVCRWYRDTGYLTIREIIEDTAGHSAAAVS